MRPSRAKILKYALSIAIVALTIYYCDYKVMTAMGQKVIFNDAAYYVYNYIPILLLLAFLLSISNRFLFSCLLTSIVPLTAVAINTTKYEILNKPFIPTDLLLYRQILDNTDLFSKYMPLKNVAGVAVIGIIIFSYVLFKEKLFFRNTIKVKTTRAVTAIFLMIAATTIPHQNSYVQNIYSQSLLIYCLHDPTSTVKQSGFFYNFIRMSSGMSYTIPETYGDTSIIKNAAASVIPAMRVKPAPSQLPNIIVVQSEAFYDLRKHNIEIDEKAYFDFDKAAKNSVLKGSVRVPTIAGYTIKTEFSFLTGISLAALPGGCDYPYRFLVRKDLWGLAQHLKSIGYKTIFVHPYSRTFWDRNIAVPLLGFDEFLDIRYFSDASKEGCYVSDIALADRVTSITQNTAHPLFIFAVTMENHGPWDSKRVINERKFRLAGKITETDREQLGRYLHHVVNAGKMANALIENFKNTPRPTLVAFYGDHAPGFNNLFDRIKPREEKDSISETPYFIWKNYGKSKPLTKDMDVSFLASTILDEAELNNDEYFQANHYYRDISGGRYENDAVNDELKRSYRQLMYNNLLNGLGKSYTAKKHQENTDDAVIDSNTVITDFGPKEITRGTGFNVQPDGNSALWLIASGINNNHILFADGKPLTTSQVGDGKTITAVVPKYMIDEKKTIKLYLKDMTRHKRSKDVYLTVN